MEGFFGGAEFATPATSAATHGVPVETSISPTEPIPIDKGTHTGEVSEVTPPPTETPSVQRGATPLIATQIETTLVTPLVISTGDPFVALSQVVKDGSSLVVTPSSIPVFAIRGPDADLSFEESEDILKDFDDEPVLGRRIFLSFFFFFFAKFNFPLLFACPFLLFAEPFEGLGIATNVGVSAAATPVVPTTPIPAVSSVPVSIVFTAFVSAIPFVRVSILPIAPIIIGLRELSFSLFLSSFLPHGFVSHFFLKGFSSHALCFLDRSSSYDALSV